MKPKDLSSVSEKINSLSNITERLARQLPYVKTSGKQSRRSIDAIVEDLHFLTKSLRITADSIPDRSIDDAKLVCEVIETTLQSVSFVQGTKDSKPTTSEAMKALNLVLDALAPLDAEDTSHVYKGVRYVRDTFRASMSIDLVVLSKVLGLTRDTEKKPSKRSSKKVPF